MPIYLGRCDGVALSIRSEPAKDPTSQDVSGCGLRVLVAEDNRVNQAVATRMLQKMGHTVAIAGNGIEALELVAGTDFDLVLMDLQMPEMDGITATKKIREQELETKRHLPIVAVTAHAMKGDRERCLEAGMDGYIPKPISARQVEDAIRKYARREIVNSEFGQTHAPELIAANARASKDWDACEVKARLGADEKLLGELVEIFLSETPGQLAELRHALANGDAGQVGEVAHSLKGELSCLGMAELSECARQLEEMGRSRELKRADEVISLLEERIFDVWRVMRHEAASLEVVSSAPGRRIQV